MRDATGRLAAVTGRDRPRAFAAISEAVWWVTIVDATLVRHHPDTYDAVLAGQAQPERGQIEGTLSGLRFVRNRMGQYLDPVDFIQPAEGRSATAKACARSPALTLPSRSVVSRMATSAQPSALGSVPGRRPSSQFSLPHFCWSRLTRFQFSLFQATRQRAEQNRACSRLGMNSMPQRSHRLVSAIWSGYA